MGRRNQKHLRRSAIAKKQHNTSSRRFEKFDVTIESVQSLSLSRHEGANGKSELCEWAPEERMQASEAS